MKFSHYRTVVAVTGVLWACGMGTGVAMADPREDTAALLDANAGSNKRIKALDKLWEAMAKGEIDNAAVRETTKTVIWKSSAPPPLRQAALAKLLGDTSQGADADTRQLLRLRLPTEAQWPVIDDICKAVKQRAGDPAWQELTGALVRSYARKVPTPPDPDRPERAALTAMYPDQTIEQIAFKVYMKPAGEINGGELPGQSADLIEKQRQAAWELLGRLDPDGSKRASFLAGVPQDDPAVVPISKAATDLKCVPVTGSELAWVKRLLDTEDAGNAAWWAEASAAVKQLNEQQTKGLQLRHLEAIRWAAKNRPTWIVADRETLLSDLAKRLEGRRKWRKTAEMGESGRLSKEMLTDWRDQLVWGDVVTMLVIDDAIQEPRVIRALFEQAQADQADSSTEYGGGLWATDEVAGMPENPIWGVKKDWPAGFVARGYSPRPGQRVNDRTFVAPEDLFTAEGAGGRSLAHYHFHVQTKNNADYAGPGFGDLEYATTHGRACVVFTSVKSGVMNADYYQRGGVMVDLGEIREGK